MNGADDGQGVTDPAETGFFGKLSIDRKLLLIIMLVSSVAMVISAGAFITYQWYRFRDRMVNDLSVQAEMVADNLTGAISFSDPDDAREVLESLKAELPIAYACVYNLEGAVFAQYRRQDFTAAPPPGPGEEGPRFEENRLVMSRKIILDGRHRGTVYLQSDLSELDAFLRQSLGALALMILLASVFAFLLSSKLRQVVTRPLFALANTAGKVSKDRDYSVRAQKTSQDEFGLLTDAFNNMLEQVEKRDLDLRNLRNLLSNIVNSMPSVLVGVDQDACVTQWNREAEKVTGVSAGDAQGKHLEDVFPQLAGDIEKVRTSIRNRETQKDTKVASESGGEIRYTDVTVYPLVDNGVTGAVIRVDDVTELVRIEEMMIQSEKMLSVGGLAAGMAHEINNPLAGILQNAQVVQNRLSQSMPKNLRIAEECGVSFQAITGYMEKRGVPSMLDAIIESGRRASRIVDNMLSFSRKSESRFNYHKMDELLDSIVELASNEYDLKKKYDFRQIEIIREYHPDTPEVCCESSKLQQVFLNILKNGAHAMAEKKGPQNVSRFILRVRPEGPMVRVEIEDNGPGMDEDTRKRVFEPFFTTKAVGLGTGLGLSVSYFIVTENHNGTMAVESSPGNGSNFIIRLPVCRDEK